MVQGGIERNVRNKWLKRGSWSPLKVFNQVVLKNL